MQAFSQYDPKYSGHVLGWGPGVSTIGHFGCYDCVCAMIAWLFGFKYDPSSFDVRATLLKIFVRDSTGTYDFLPDNALDAAFKGHFKTTAIEGYHADVIAAAVKAPDEAAYLHIAGWSPFWGMNIATHYVGPMLSAATFIDPAGGVVRALSAYGGPGNVLKTHIVKFLDPSIAAAARAAAAAALAASAAKAKAGAAAAVASAAKTAAAAAAAAAAQKAARDAAAAAAAAASAAGSAISGASAAGSAPGKPIEMPTAPPAQLPRDWLSILLTILHALGILK